MYNFLLYNKIQLNAIAIKINMMKGVHMLQLNKLN